MAQHAEQPWSGIERLIISHQSSVISHQSSVISHQSSVISGIERLIILDLKTEELSEERVKVCMAHYLLVHAELDGAVRPRYDQGHLDAALQCVAFRAGMCKSVNGSGRGFRGRAS